MKLRDLSIRARLQLLLAGVGVFALALAAVVLVMLELQRSRQAVADEMASLARLIGGRSSAALVFGDQATARENVAALAGRRDVELACLFDAQGALLAVHPGDGGCSPAAPLAEERLRVEGLRVQVQWPVRIEGGELAGAILLNSSAAPLRRRFAELGWSLAVAVAAASALTVLLSLRLHRVITGPLERVRAVADAIDRRGDPSLRVGALGDHEVGRLARAFDRMLDTVERQNKDLAAREAYSRRLFQDSRVAQLVYDEQRRCIDCNPAALALFGAGERAALLGGRLDEHFAAHPRLRDLGADAAAELECSLRRPDGTGWTAQADLIGFVQDRRALLHCLVRDVSAQRVADEARRGQLAAEAASRAKTDFLSRMSHELRTPLNAVLGFLQLLERDAARLDERQRRYVAMSLQAGWHLLTLIDDTLDLVRIEAGRMEVRLQEVDPAAVLAQAAMMVEAQAAEAGVTVVRGWLGRELPRVQADPLRLQQVLINLLSNALKYNRRGGHAWVEAEAGGDALRITIADDGLGIPQERQAQLFEPFNRLGRESGLVPGSGIGLALSRELARLMGGDVVVHSAAGAGTQVTVLVPLQPPAAVPAAAPPRPGPPSAAASEPAAPADPPGGPRGTVLYIEDNPVNQALVEEVLRPFAGLRLLQADRGDRGLELVAQGGVDLVLLDMHLPDTHGLELLARLRERLRWGGPVVALSASAMPADVDAALRAGAVAYWTKPIDLLRFAGQLAELLEALRARSAPAAAGA